MALWMTLACCEAFPVKQHPVLQGLAFQQEFDLEGMRVMLPEEGSLLAIVAAFWNALHRNSECATTPQ